MNFIESGRTKNTPSFPGGGAESEPTPKGFRVEIENPQRIWEQMRVAAPEWTLGHVALEEPFKSFSVYVCSDGEQVQISTGLSTEKLGFVFLDEETILEELKPKLKVSDELSKADEETIFLEKLKLKKVGTRLLVLGENDKPEYEINLKVGGLGTIFSAGTSSSTAGPRPIGDFKSFKKELTRLAKITEVVIKAAYKKINKEPPDVTLVFRPPLKVESIGFSGTKRLSDFVLERVSVEERPKISFDKIGDLEEAKREIESLVFALTNPELYQRWGTKPPKGILLTGPPGTGKTLLAKALAAQAEARFFHVEVSDVVSKWYGEAEKLMKAVFEEAGKGGKTIIFFDELDALAPHRGESHEASTRIVSTMLVNLDGLKANPNILVVAATNRPEAIDSALLRPGRFDRIVEVPLPNKEGREKILAIHIKKAEELAGRQLFADDFDIGKIAEATENFSGADLGEIIRRVLEEKVRLEGRGEKPGKVTTEDLLKVIASYEGVKRRKKKLGFV